MDGASKGVCTAVTTCRSCDSADLEGVFDLGLMPLSDGFARSGTAPDPHYPLEVLVCNACGLAQLRHTVAPDALFDDDYPYFSSYSQTVVDNARANVEQALTRFAPPPDALVVELASNDGYLLRHVAARGFRTLGIDPASGPVAAARAAGIETLHAFFTEDLAEELAASGRQANLIFGNNVLAHVADTGGFVRGIARLLKPGGTAIIEAPYLRDLIEHGEFDTIYHEHLCYFSVAALRQLFARHGLALNDVERIPIHGGSIRLSIQHADAPAPRMLALLAEEHALGLDGAEAFRRFAERTAATGETLHALLRRLKSSGARIAAYGAAAKGTILLNHFGLGRDMLDWVADANPHKHGRFVPGVKLEIVPPSRIVVDRPDYLLLLPWNHKEEIMRQQAAFLAAGGRFIVPIPEPAILDALGQPMAPRVALPAVA